MSGPSRKLLPLVERGNLSDYELAQVSQFIAFSYYNSGDIDSAIHWFRRVLDIESLETPMRLSTLYVLAQLYAANEDYTNALAYNERWLDQGASPTPQQHIFRAQVLYQLDRVREMIAPIETAIALAIERDVEIQEEWYALLSFAYFQQEDFAAVRDINKVLVANWPRKRYWMYLANAYRELGNDDAMLYAYDAAQTQGLLETEAEILNLAQLYLQYGVPYKSGGLLESAMNDGRIEKSSKNYRLLSQSWTMASEDARSVEPLRIAAELDDESGELDVRLGNVYLRLDRNSECVDAVTSGVEKGGLRNPDYAHITLGMCFYNQREYRAAIGAFRKAEDVPRSARIARQWIRSAELEIAREIEIRDAEARANQQAREIAARRAQAESG